MPIYKHIYTYISKKKEAGTSCPQKTITEKIHARRPRSDGTIATTTRRDGRSDCWCAIQSVVEPEQQWPNGQAKDEQKQNVVLRQADRFVSEGCRGLPEMLSTGKPWTPLPRARLPFFRYFRRPFVFYFFIICPHPSVRCPRVISKLFERNSRVFSQPRPQFKHFSSRPPVSWCVSSNRS